MERIIDRVAQKQIPQQRPDGSFHPDVMDANTSDLQRSWTLSIVYIMISFQYFDHLFLLMCNIPTTGIWIDGL